MGFGERFTYPDIILVNSIVVQAFANTVGDFYKVGEHTLMSKLYVWLDQLIILMNVN